MLRFITSLSINRLNKAVFDRKRRIKLRFRIINFQSESGFYFFSALAIITIFFKDFPLLRWYLNNEKILEMDIDARFVNSESVHLSICKFFTDISDLLSNDIYIVDDIIREHPLVLMEFIPMKTPKVLKHIKYLDM